MRASRIKKAITAQEEAETVQPASAYRCKAPPLGGTGGAGTQGSYGRSIAINAGFGRVLDQNLERFEEVRIMAFFLRLRKSQCRAKFWGTRLGQQ